MYIDGSQAIIPKARGMYAKRIQPAEYEELMRRRTVPEVAVALKKHPYFGDSLATLSQTDPHREQVEELLAMDIFNKYEALVHYEFASHSFADYFIIECEVQEILRAMRFLSNGVVGRYINHLPPFLEGQIRFDLFRLAEATNFEQVLDVLRYTPYYKPLRAYWYKDPLLRDYPSAEAVLIRFYYSEVFRLAGQYFSGREEKAVRELFLQEAENYNVNVILRAKTYFGDAFSPDDIRSLLLPYNHRIPKSRLREMVNAKGVEPLLELYQKMSGQTGTVLVSPGEFDALAGRLMYRYARRILHLTTSPSAALAAFIALAKLERDNVVNVVEGVRYGMPPEKIRALLRY